MDEKFAGRARDCRHTGMRFFDSVYQTRRVLLLKGSLVWMGHGIELPSLVMNSGEDLARVLSHA
jgi:hypothetical protein